MVMTERMNRRIERRIKIEERLAGIDDPEVLDDIFVCLINRAGELDDPLIAQRMGNWASGCGSVADSAMIDEWQKSRG